MIALILSLLIVAALVFVAISFYTRRGNTEGEDMRAPIESARSVECQAQIRRVKMQVDIFRFENDRYPERLELLGDLSITDLYCPVTGSRYDYDAGCGIVSCPDHNP